MSARTVPSTHRAAVRFPARCQSCRLSRVPPERQRAAHIAARGCCRVGCCMRPRQRTLSRRTSGLNGLAGLRSCCVAISEINCCCWCASHHEPGVGNSMMANIPPVQHVYAQGTQTLHHTSTNTLEHATSGAHPCPYHTRHHQTKPHKLPKPSQASAATGE